MSALLGRVWRTAMWTFLIGFASLALIKPRVAMGAATRAATLLAAGTERLLTLTGLATHTDDRRARTEAVRRGAVRRTPTSHVTSEDGS